MLIARRHPSPPAVMSLETAAAAARGGFACMFSTSDEYETALIAERRAQGRYLSQPSRWPRFVFVGCVLMIASAVMLLA